MLWRVSKLIYGQSSEQSLFHTKFATHASDAAAADDDGVKSFLIIAFNQPMVLAY